MILCQLGQKINDLLILGGTKLEYLYQKLLLLVP